ncbi:mercuric transporter MerT family protein [Microbulbifer magnicolonia]|uniref:mercuric transporter MerT family protein n=1 Tax=Microbulbifer magnicolonia TaxID=3109744 RepID=UPI002B406EE1|nr:mercuric transporter MerT family protein [Microbulbifer sp. GG15]
MPTDNTRLPLIGGIAAAIGAGLCCAGPFVLLSLGISGAWIGNLTLLEPYRPLFILAVLTLFGWAGWKVFGPCAPGSACAAPRVRRRRQLIFVLAALAAALLVTSNYWIPWIA